MASDFDDLGFVEDDQEASADHAELGFVADEPEQQPKAQIPALSKTQQMIVGDLPAGFDPVDEPGLELGLRAGAGVKDPEVMNDAIQSSARGYTYGVSDKIKALGDTGADYLSQYFTDSTPVSAEMLLKANLQAQEHVKQASRERSPGATQTAELLSSLASPIPAGKLIKAGDKAGKLVKGMAYAGDAAAKGGIIGGLTGLGDASLVDDKGNFDVPVGDIGSKILTGAGLGVGVQAGLDGAMALPGLATKGKDKFYDIMAKMQGISDPAAKAFKKNPAMYAPENIQELSQLKAGLDAKMASKNPNVAPKVQSLKEEVASRLDVEKDALQKFKESEASFFKGLRDSMKDESASPMQSAKIVDSVKAVQQQTRELDDAAFDILEQSGVTVPKAELLAVIENAKRGLTTSSGAASSLDITKKAHDGLSKLQDDISKMDTGGSIPGVKSASVSELPLADVKMILKEIDSSLDYGMGLGEKNTILDALRKNVRGSIRARLGQAAPPEFNKIQAQIAERAEFLKKANDLFGQTAPADVIQKANRGSVPDIQSTIGQLDSLSGQDNLSAIKELLARKRALGTPSELEQIRKATPAAEQVVAQEAQLAAQDALLNKAANPRLEEMKALQSKYDMRKAQVGDTQSALEGASNLKTAPRFDREAGMQSFDPSIVAEARKLGVHNEMYGKAAKDPMGQAIPISRGQGAREAGKFVVNKLASKSSIRENFASRLSRKVKKDPGFLQSLSPVLGPKIVQQLLQGENFDANYFRLFQGSPEFRQAIQQLDDQGFVPDEDDSDEQSEPVE